MKQRDQTLFNRETQGYCCTMFSCSLVELQVRTRSQVLHNTRHKKDNRSTEMDVCGSGNDQGAIAQRSVVLKRRVVFLTRIVRTGCQKCPLMGF